MQRSGITDPKDMCLWIADSSFPEEVDVALDFRCDNIHELNELALVVEKFSIHDRKKLGGSSKHGQTGKRQPDPPPGGEHGSV